MKGIISTLLLFVLISTAWGFDFSNPYVDNATVEHLTALFDNVEDNYTCAAPFDKVRFPEGTHLERCLRDTIGDNRWPIICKDAANITSLTCIDSVISSLDGLQQFPNLITLTFPDEGTQISDLAPIRNLTKLQTLDIPNSKISNTAFLSKMKNLRRLNLSWNHITDLRYFPYLTRLDTLSLEYQWPDYISDITPLQALYMLRNLSLRGNKITDISPLAKTPAIAYLTLRDNRIADLSPLTAMPNLTGLDAAINMIDNITPLATHSKMTFLVLSANRLTNMEAIRPMENLRQLKILGNNITDISPVAGKRKILDISLDYNAITDLSPIFDIMVYSNLAQLGLAYNCISEDNYSRVKYLNTIEWVRLDHQCEEPNSDIAIVDDSFVVNGDLVGSKPVLDNGTIGDGDNITAKPVNIGGGCSAGNGSAYVDFVYVALLMMLFLRKRWGRKTC